jgi:4-amino-4-deoxy-L-arabinose transferase-like glycosyltransferase
MDEKMANSGGASSGTGILDTAKNQYLYLAVLLFAGAIYLGGIVSPPSLMDDSDAVLAQAARTMLVTGDWVTPRLDGVAYLA